MPSLSEEITQLENTLTTALAELAALETKVSRLEAENAKLIQHLSPYSDSKAPAKPQPIVKTKSDGLNALAKLYAEGYHVCHPAFGQMRDNHGTQDCIYCLEVLKGAGS